MKGAYLRTSLYLVLLIWTQACAPHKLVAFEGIQDPYSIHYFGDVAIDSGVGGSWRGISLRSGNVLWQAKGFCSARNPINREGKLYLAPDSEYLLCVSVTDGRTNSIPTKGFSIKNVLCHADNLLVASTSDGKIIEYSLADRRVAWTIPDLGFWQVFPYEEFLLATHAHRKDTRGPVHAGPRIAVIDKGTGEMRPFPLKADESKLFCADVLPANDFNWMYININDAGTGRLQSVNPTDLKVRWEIEAIVDEIAAYQDMLVVKTSDRVMGIDSSTARIKWEVPLKIDLRGDSMQLSDMLSVCSGLVVAISANEGAFYSIDVRNGGVLEKFQAGISTSPYL